MTVRARPICVGCRFFDSTGETLRCDAYPAGIPAAILENRADHRRPLRGDHGIQFQPKDERAAAYAATIFSENEP